MPLKDYLKTKTRRKAGAGDRTSDLPSDTKPSSAHRKEERYGLFALYTPETTENAYPVDIVFIHGLNGHYKQTWTHPNGGSEVLWPKDLLPQTLPGARIFSYGYPSQVFANNSVARIRHFATSLLECLSSKRSGQEYSSRPIIYVCHSLGGIVVKQALITAWNQSDQIGKASKAIIFMGTPHRGSPSATYGKAFGDIANLILHTCGVHYLIGGVNTSLIKILREKSYALSEIAEDFCPRAKDLRIVSFYEQVIDPWLKRIIVDQSSATLLIDKERSLPLFLNHQDLCRFSGMHDSNYQQVSHEIESLAKEITQEKEPKTEAISIRSDLSYDAMEKQCVVLLNTVDVEGYESKLDIAVKGTLEWIFKTSQFTLWTSEPSVRMLLVTGHPGCGKTTLAAFITRYLSREPQNSALICRFFCDNKIDELRDPAALLRSIIFQITNRRRRALRQVKKNLERRGSQMFGQFDPLWTLFLEIVRADRKYEIIIIIDAIDEWDKKDRRQLITHISELMDSEETPSIKFLITSRPVVEGEITISKNIAHLVKLPLEESKEHINNDIEHVIRDRLRQMVFQKTCQPKSLNEIENLLIAKADRTFLWIKLVFSWLEPRRTLLLSDPQTIAHLLPSGLTSLYEQLLLDIPEAERDFAARILRFLATCDRALSGEEIGILMTIEPHHKLASSLTSDRLRYDQDSVILILGSLVRRHNSRLELVHQSLKDYLIALSDKTGDIAETFGINIAREKLEIFSRCSMYLKLTNFQKNIQLTVQPREESLSSTETEAPDENASAYGFGQSEEPIHWGDDEKIWAFVTDEYKLFDYAALHWAADFSKSNAVATESDHQSALALCECDTAQFNNWFHYFWFQNMHPKPLPEADTLMVVSYFGQVDTLCLLLNRDPLVGSLEQGLYWAAKQGQNRCVETILRWPQCNPHIAEIQGQTPISAAAEFGQAECVSVLLNDGRTDVNKRDRQGRTPLSLAASNNHDGIVSLLLNHPKISVNLPDVNLKTVLHHAVTAGSSAAVSQLLRDSRVIVDQVDKYQRSALSWAAEYGHADIVRLLLESNLASADHKDEFIRSPLSYASQHQHLRVVKMLHKSNRVDLLGQDKDGRNAHSWAAEHRKSSVLLYLVKHCQHGADIPDCDGWTPLAWTLKSPVYLENTLHLLQLGCVDLNRKDSVNGRTVLSLASDYGFTQVARELVGLKGVDLESQDFDGRTPLSYAASRDNTEILEILIATNGVDVNSKDKHGRTPLLWALREGSFEAVEFLLAKAATDTGVRDNDGRTAMDTAGKFQGEKIWDDRWKEIVSLLSGESSKVGAAQAEMPLQPPWSALGGVCAAHTTVSY